MTVVAKYSGKHEEGKRFLIDWIILAKVHPPNDANLSA